jgi:hypothetical protein
MTPRRKSFAFGAAAWLVVVFGLFGAGLRHQDLVAAQRAYDAGRWPGPIDAVRAYVTNDGDARRYFAYAQATLGRPYQAYFVRTAEAWRRAFAAGERYDPDGAPTVVPPRPLVPYRDFLVEYPPGFFAVAIPPALLASDADGYVRLFEALMAALATAAFLLVADALRRLGRPLPAAAPAWAAASALALGVVVTHRYDAAVAAAVALAAWAAVARRPALLGAALGAAVALKGVPLVVVPIFAMHAARERRDLARAALAAAAALAVAVIPAALAAGPHLVATLAYHADRPVQIESAWGGLVGLVHAVAPGAGAVAVEKTFGSTNLVGRAAGVAASLSTLATAAGLGVVYLAARRRLRAPLSADRARATLAAAAAALAVFAAGGKVGSPQYLVWFWPLGLGLSLTLASRPRRALALLVAALALTQLVYPVTYRLLEALHPAICTLVVARSALLVAWAATLLHDAQNPPLAKQPC